MSTLTGENHTTILKREEELRDYFRSFVKPDEKKLIGVEVEVFAVHRETGKAMPYSGEQGIEAMFQALSRRYGYLPVMDGDHAIALTKGDRVIGLEPGGQIELSAPPVSSFFEMGHQILGFRKELTSLKADFPNVRFIAVGFQPFSGLEEIEWVPKTRYQIMAEYLKTHGTLSHEMMKRTATNHFNFDYSSEADAMESLRAVFTLTSLVTALFANSSFSEGAPNGFYSRRLHIWNHTDPARSGLLSDFAEPGKTFQDYLNYVLDIPVIFVVRNKQWIPLKHGVTFRRFIKEGYEGIQATVGDFDLHLSSIFPEARFKQYLEVRGTDGQSPELIPAAGALWKGILYHPKSRSAAIELFRGISKEERMRIHRAIPETGWQMTWGKHSFIEMAEEIIRLSREGLTVLGKDLVPSETLFLKRIEDKILKRGMPPGKQLAEAWAGPLKKSPAALIESLSLG